VRSVEPRTTPVSACAPVCDVHAHNIPPLSPSKMYPACDSLQPPPSPVAHAEVTTDESTWVGNSVNTQSVPKSPPCALMPSRPLTHACPVSKYANIPLAELPEWRRTMLPREELVHLHKRHHQRRRRRRRSLPVHAITHENDSLDKATAGNVMIPAEATLSDCKRRRRRRHHRRRCLPAHAIAQEISSTDKIIAGNGITPTEVVFPNQKRRRHRCRLPARLKMACRTRT
jgi:hypothetical protein